MGPELQRILGITDRNQTEENLRKSEQLFRSIFENAQIGISFFNIHGGVVFTNRAFQEMLGYTEKELADLANWGAIVHPEERAAGEERYAELVQGKHEKDEWEQRFVQRDGRILVANARFTLIRDAEGKPQYVASLTEDITERKRAQEERNRLTKQMELLLESTGQGIYGIDLQGRCAFINRATCEMIGYRPEEALGRNMHELVHHHKPDGSPYPVDECPVYRAFKKGQGCRVDTEVIWRRDGTAIPVEYSSFPILEGAKITGAVVTVVDITERKQSEEKVRESEQLFRSIFENAQIGIGVFDINKQELKPNRTLQEMLGYSEKELSRLETWDEITPADERAADAKRYAELVQGKREKDVWEQRLIRGDGRIAVTSVRFSLLRDAAGRPQYVASLQEDITERRAAEDLLRKREEELRRANFLADTALELSKAGYWHVPLDGSGWYNSSPRRVAVFGDLPHPDHRYRLDEIFGHASEGDEAAAKIAREAFNAAVEGKTTTYDAVFAYKRPIDGRIAWVHALGHVQKDAEGKPTDMYGVSQDITEFKRMEAELVTAKESAEAATKAKSDFLANMSHEIRTPMNAILGMIHLALKTELAPKQRDYLTKTRVAAQSLLGIINDILDFSKIEAGKLDMEETNFRLEDLLENLSSVVGQKAQEKNLEFLIVARHDLPPNLVGDPLRLGQILINLVNNAVKFTDRGEVVVTVVLEEQFSDRVKLKFSVRDSGIGLTPDQSARLFQAFSQADSSTTRKHGGTGLGLSISKRLVELMEGNIWVESEYGRGSTFCFTAWFGVGTSAQREKILPPGLTGTRALVVDDNAAVREILSETLKQFGLSVECVPSGAEAMRELMKADSSTPYQVVLMDWQMPELDGLETSRRIKRAGTLRNPPRILMVTAFDREDIRLQAQELQIEGFLLKPVSPSVLFDTLMNLFGVAQDEKALESAGKIDRDLALVSGIRVLLVEDNEVNQQVATELMESEGAKVTIANHGAEAVKILTQNKQPPPFDVVLMDLQMPEMDGLTATRLLRAQAHLKNLPIIAMTAHVMADEVQRCLDAGMNDHVSKPIDPDSFFATLARWTRAHAIRFQDAPVKTARAHDEISLPELSGVDIAVGLRRIGGNRRLYRDLLAQFAEKQKSAGDRIAAALETGDRNQAERLAHSLKGAAGNLGIDRIFHSAGNLEKAIRESQDGVNEMIRELTSELDRQVQTIQERLAVASEIPGKGDGSQAVDPIAVSKAMAQLRDLLKASDASAREAYTGLAELLQGRIDPLRLQALSAAVRAFNFETALVKLNEIADQFGAKKS